MTEPGHCPRCHVVLTADAPAGLCPSCLMQLALELTTGGADQSSRSELFPEERFAPDMTIPENLRSFGDYELLQQIARGGMGVIYKARQISLNRIVAVKMMLPGLAVSEAEAQRFQTEAEAIANLRHPNIVAIYEVGAHEGQRYFSMEYIEGQSLAAMIRDHPLPEETAARYVKVIAEAMQYAHRQGILHRDLKPSNVLLDKTGKPCLTDFGLAKRMGSDSRLTASGVVLGTPSYMPPEQAAGKNKQLGPASDVYSIGAILYELLTGRPPFQAATSLDTVLLVINSEPIAPRLLNPKLSRDLETICLKCLEKDARRRYPSAQELADDLDRYLNRKPIKARPISVLNRAWRWSRRSPWPTAAAAAIVLLLLAVLASGWAISSRRTAMISEQRLRQSLFEQVRSERLAGDRAESLKTPADAAGINSAPELRQEAGQMITISGARLLREFEGVKVAFSPDGKMLAVIKPQKREGKVTGALPAEIELLETQTGRLLDRFSIDHIPWRSLFRPDGSRLVSNDVGKIGSKWPPPPMTPLPAQPANLPPIEIGALVMRSKTLAVSPPFSPTWMPTTLEYGGEKRTPIHAPGTHRIIRGGKIIIHSSTSGTSGTSGTSEASGTRITSVGILRGMIITPSGTSGTSGTSEASGTSGTRQCFLCLAQLVPGSPRPPGPPSDIVPSN